MRAGFWGGGNWGQKNPALEKTKMYEKLNKLICMLLYNNISLKT